MVCHVQGVATLCDRGGTVPAVPSSLFEPIWDQFSVLLPQRPEFDPTHPLGCHRRRIPDKTVFRLVVEALVHGSGYERIATVECSDWTIRDRLKQWSTLGLTEQLHRIALAGYDRMIGLDLEDLSADGCTTKAPRHRREGRSFPGGPGQAGPEALHDGRWRRHTAGDRLGRGQPP
jgi:hypothetical protein